MPLDLRLLRSAGVAAIATALASHAAPAQHGRADIVRVTDSLAGAAVGNGVAGMSIAVVRGHDTLVMKGYGYADIENDVPATPQTVYRIGSITKQFTSAAVMQLVEQGRVGLEEPITTYLPGYPTHGEHILVRHLLNHTSGIPSYTDIGPAFGARMRLDLQHDSLLALVKDRPLLFAPGTHYYYNNTGYYLLGVIVEHVTGRPYAEYLAERLFRPLGLTSTVYCSVAPIIKHRAQGYGRNDNVLVNADFISMDAPFAAGSLCSTVRDLVAWTAALSSGRVVSMASYQRMTTPVTLPSGRAMSYGFGLFSRMLGTHREIEHGGGINGFISQLELFPDDSLTIVVLANTAPAPSGEVATNIARAVFGLPLEAGPPPPLDVAVSPDELPRYAGNYKVTMPDGSSTTARVFATDGRLTLQLTGAPVRLLRQQANVFALAGQPGQRLTFDVVGDRATGFQLDRGSRPIEGVRVP